jgi:TonB-linked SusC/RagA family outer membrane protein
MGRCALAQLVEIASVPLSRAAARGKRVCRPLAAIAIATYPLHTVRAQEPATLSGIVTTTAGKPLSGAEVRIPAFGIGTAARVDGSYVIPLPADSTPRNVTVTARLIGYERSSVDLSVGGGSITQDFVLALNPLQLGELVVTGPGTAAEVEKLGTVRDRIDSTAIMRSNEQNLVTALSAKAPGVVVTSASGDPAASAYIQIRGITSIESSSGQPLFVIDGVPVDNSNLAGFDAGSATFDANRLIDVNPADIENIEALKGAAAGAIYGSRAGQGVILITTKKGRGGQVRSALRSSWSIDEHTQLPRLQQEYGLGSGGVSDPCVSSADPALLNCEVQLIQSYGPRLPPGTPVYDHSDEIFQTGWTTDNALSISGGSDRTQFYLSGDYSYRRGIVVGDQNHFRRIAVRLNASQQITQRLKFAVNVAYSDANAGYVQTRNNTAAVLLGAWRTPAEFNNLPYLDPLFGLHRSYRFPNPGPGSERIPRGYDNPFFSANEAPASDKVARTFGNLDADWTPTDWLRVHETLGLDHYVDEFFKGWPWSSSEWGGGGAVTSGYLKNEQIDHNLTATITYDLSAFWHGTITVGQNLNWQSRRDGGALGVGLLTPQPFTFGNTADIAGAGDGFSKARLESYFAQVTADLGERVSLTAALRNDGGSTFGEDRRRAWYPKASAAWVFSRSAAGIRRLLTYGKLRAAYGQSGTQPPPYGVGTGFEPAYVGGLGSRANRPITTLGPERVKEFEAGVDLGLLDDKADLSITHYRQNSTGVILGVPVAPSSGYVVERANAGELQNRGWEVSLNLRPVTTRGFAWDVGFQWARNRGLTTRLPAGIQSVGMGGFVNVGGAAIVGEPIGVYYGIDYARCGRGVIVAGVDLDRTAGECEGAPNGALYLGPDGQPVVDIDHQYVIGDPNPAWTGAVRTDLRIGKSSIGGLLDVRHGGLGYNQTQGALNEFGTGLTTAEGRNGPPVTFGTDYYPGPEPGPVAGPGVGVPVKLDEGWFRGAGSLFSGVASPFMEPGGWVKLREISVAYTMDQSWVSRKLGFSSVELRLSGRNLVSWNSYSGIDPETSVFASVTPVRGMNYYNNPQTRSWVATITLNR